MSTPLAALREWKFGARSPLKQKLAVLLWVEALDVERPNQGEPLHLTWRKGGVGQPHGDAVVHVDVFPKSKGFCAQSGYLTPAPAPCLTSRGCRVRCQTSHVRAVSRARDRGGHLFRSADATTLLRRLPP